MNRAEIRGGAGGFEIALKPIDPFPVRRRRAMPAGSLPGVAQIGGDGGERRCRILETTLDGRLGTETALACEPRAEAGEGGEVKPDAARLIERGPEFAYIGSAEQ